MLQCFNTENPIVLLTFKCCSVFNTENIITTFQLSTLKRNPRGIVGLFQRQKFSSTIVDTVNTLLRPHLDIGTAATANNPSLIYRPIIGTAYCNENSILLTV